MSIPLWVPCSGFCTPLGVKASSGVFSSFLGELWRGFRPVAGERGGGYVGGAFTVCEVAEGGVVWGDFPTRGDNVVYVVQHVVVFAGDPGDRGDGGGTRCFPPCDGAPVYV